MGTIHYTRFEFGEPRRQLTFTQQAIAFVVRMLITAAAVWAAAKIVGGIEMEGWQAFLFAGAVLGALNAFVKPALVVGALPFIVITLGIGLVIINVLFLAFTAWLAGKFDQVQFHVDGFWSAFFGAILISLLSFFISRIISPDRVALAATGRR